MTDGGTVESQDARHVAIVGMAGKFPEAPDLEAFWNLLREGREGIRPFGDDELLAAGVDPALLADPRYVKAGSVLDEPDRFDAPFFGYSAREAELLDPQQRLFLEHVWHALEDAGYAGERSGLVGVYAGVAWNTYLLSNLSRRLDLFDGAGAFQVFITNDKDFMPTRVSYKLDLKGPSVIVQTSCSTSLVAVHLACLGLLSYECDMAVAGGVTVKVPQVAGYHYEDGGLASPDGHCRTFDARAAGTVFGSGVGTVVLKRLGDALADGDSIRAVIRGSAINNDGSAKVSYTAPSVEGQSEVIATAQAVAGVAPETIRCIEAHGTATSLGDPIEVAALSKVFREGTDRRGFCALGSVKSNVGHLDAAAGVAGLIKTVLALEHREIPPSLHFEEPNPELDLAATPFYVPASAEPWDRGDVPRRAGVSSFGVGGTNAHVVLEEAPPAPAPAPTRPWQLLVLSARSDAALAESAGRLASHLRAAVATEAELADVAYTLRRGRAVFRHRAFVVAGDPASAAAGFADPGAGKLMTGTDLDEPRDRPLAFLFPGQGAQHAGMGRGLYEHEPVFRRWVDRAAEIVSARTGADLPALLLGDGPEAAAELERTEIAQPALFVVEYGLALLWESLGVRPRAMLGHSVGEYVAACVAGVFSAEDALGLLTVRGRLMQERPEGVMASVALSEADLAPLLGDELSLAAVNGPERCTVSGPAEAMAALEERLARQDVRCSRLHTSHAFHSGTMDAVVEPFAEAVRAVGPRAPRVPFVANVTGTWITAEEATDPLYWGRQLRAPVRFADGLALLFEDPDRLLLEVGPGTTLTTLAGRHPERRERPVISSLGHARAPRDDRHDLLSAAGRLWLQGVRLDEEGLLAGEARRRVRLPLYPFERRRYWIEPPASDRNGVRATSPAGSSLGSGRESGEGAADGADSPRAALEDWFYLPSWRRTLSLGTRAADGAVSSTGGASWIVLHRGDRLGTAVAEALERAGHRVVMVEPGEAFRARGEGAYTVDPTADTSWRRLVSELLGGEEGRRGAGPVGVVHAWTLDSAFTRDADGFDRAQAEGFHAVVRLLRALQEAGLEAGGGGAELSVSVITDRLMTMTGDEQPAPETAPLLGLCRVLPQEWPGARARVIGVRGTSGTTAGRSGGADAADLASSADAAEGADQDWPAAMAENVVAELLAGRDPVVVLGRRERWVERFDPVRLDAAAPEGAGASEGLRRGGVYLLSGAHAGNGLALARYLTREWDASLVLVDDGEPSGDAEERVRALEELGGQAVIVAGDLGDEGTWTRAVELAEERFGALHGVVHAAGTVGQQTFRTLAETGEEEAAWHFRPKAHAVYALERALGDRPLDVCVLLSSLATVVGGVAYGAYTAANCFLDQFAADHNRRGGTPWLSLDWDLWSFETGEDEITGVRSDLADLAMSPREGEEAFRRALASGVAGRLLVSTTDLAARAARQSRRIDAHRRRSEDPEQLHPRPALAVPYMAPEGDLEERIAAVWRTALGFEQIGVLDNFFDLGGDSFVAIQVTAKLRDALGVDLPAAKLYQGLTVRSLAELLSADQEAVTAALGEQLEERRASMDRRRRFQERRRSRRRGETTSDE